MPSRDILDCTELLQMAYEYGAREYKVKYPDAPQPFITCTYRSNEEQRKLYAQGRTADGPRVTNILENGKHNRYPSLAFDIAFKTSGNKVDWSAVHFKNFAAIVLAKFKSLKWGGNWRTFKDYPHFEV